MANRTDPLAMSIHGTNPQFLFSKIIRNKVYQQPYWKQNCFGLTAESIIDKAVELEYIGGTYGGNRKPSPFLCLVLKLLQIQPSKDVALEYIKNPDFKYLRALGIFYLRLTGSHQEIFTTLEPILSDYRKLRFRLQDGRFRITHMDEFIDDCLRSDNMLDVDLPGLVKREVLENINILVFPRPSALDQDVYIEGIRSETAKTTSQKPLKSQLKLPQADPDFPKKRKTRKGNMSTSSSSPSLSTSTTSSDSSLHYRHRRYAHREKRKISHYSKNGRPHNGTKRSRISPDQNSSDLDKHSHRHGNHSKREIRSHNSRYHRHSTSSDKSYNESRGRRRRH